MILQLFAALPLVPTSPAAQPVVVLLAGVDVRLLGTSVRTRNARVAARAGARLVTAAHLDVAGDAHAVVVLPGAAIDISLFPLERRSAPMQIVPAGGDRGRVLVGPSSLLRSYVADPADIARLPRELAPPGALYDVSSERSRRAAAWTILRRTAKPTDGWVSRRCNRPISRVVSFCLLSIGLGARHASALTLLVGLAAAVSALQPGYPALVITGLLFHLASVLDGADGEMARAMLTESDAGARLDTVVDHLTYIACFLGLTVGWIREGHGDLAIAWTVLVTAALLVTLLRAGRFVSRHAPDASFLFVDRAIRRAARESGRPALRMAAAAFTLLRRDVFSVVFMAVAFVGSRALIPALVAAGALIANLTFSVYRRQLTNAAYAERASEA
jgi:phosphatidylglycerophosphate synthase